MGTKIVYLDESGDSGKPEDSRSGSPRFIMTSVSMSTSDWQDNFNLHKTIRRDLKNRYGFHVTEEMHTKDFLYDHNPYRKYQWSFEARRSLLLEYVAGFSKMKLEAVNVIIDKSIIYKKDYRVLENAVKYNIQRIDNTYGENDKFIVISDTGRIKEMRRVARSICVYNQIPVNNMSSAINSPIQSMVEDILEKDSKDSCFVQIADCISYIVNTYFNSYIKKQPLPKRVSNVLSEETVLDLMLCLRRNGILNTKATSQNEFGLVIAPK